MRRRQLLTLAAGSSVLIAAGGFYALPSAQRPAALNITGAQQLLSQLQGQPLVSRQGWSPAQVFNHCAQSIEYSMQGYPELKPLWFRRSVGPLAFNAFAARGAMRHPLDEPIPGAAALDQPASVDQALARLQRAFSDFAEYAGKLQPHFAYGQLSHGEYAEAHVLHLYNHLSLLQGTTKV
ncbi:DUF1569 domain-containing protein [Pseudomonas sp. 5P_3.1_Bac2]|uniref:DUF1569 domain-containing protein n=1 Tax=Pseudomonas sp. 5P_3.1_Bac2 TaxID=2971617 RepID=UPI0021C7EDF3|nr:DUF1569 domain-containing protein [Pseudomonas sp. 5P_3.1_Bac2]MCU1716410.1 DUF1569 domain-containing protein [Pseudomonas sp. 5P_3.1_Bac2]